MIFRDLGVIDYQSAWDMQEELLQRNVKIKTLLRNGVLQSSHEITINEDTTTNHKPQTQHYFLLCEHPPVYTLGKSGKKEHVLMNEAELERNNISFFNTNRGGDITFHGPQQVVGYPILDLEKYDTDIGKYLRNLEEIVIMTLSHFGINAARSTGETGVWLDPGIPGSERKICAIGVRCSRWITMHGFALNVNTDLRYFEHIIPCGIVGKQVTSMEKELSQAVDQASVKRELRRNFEIVFDSILV